MSEGGTGQKFAYAITIVAGVASLSATIVSVVSMWLQTKNYRKPLLQRYVVRILLMVPIYSIASWTSMVSLTAAQFLDPIRDIYEAFTIYTFFQLLINYLGGERSLIVTTHGRAPVQHLWPLNHVFAKVDISDPHTFLTIKRGILQYAWLKPILSLAAIVMKATGTYQEGYIGVTSGYLWSGLVYNVSVTMSLYFLGLFWVCMHRDLQPFRPVPKFLCIKLIIFASYWQGFFLSILVWLGAVTDDVKGYTPDNLAAAIQDALICIEMPIFAVAHWYAFSWHDFANNNILSARMSLTHALRDSFGVRDLIEDSKETFMGENYRYRAFDSGDKVMAHEDSKSRYARLKEGMRYERGGKAKYWIPKPGEVNSQTPLLGSDGVASSSRTDRIHDDAHGTFDGPDIDPEEENLYESARKLEYGDWNYPVITASEPLGDRYMSTAGHFGPRPSNHATTSASSPSSRSPTSSPSNAKGKQRTVSPQTVVPMKKAKKNKKTVKHAEPDTSKVGLDQGLSPSSDHVGQTHEEGQTHGFGEAAEAGQWNDDGPGRHDDYSSRYSVAETDDIENGWDSEEQSK